MFKRTIGFLALALLLLSGSALAAPETTTGPQVFVSTFDSHQILSVDGTTGAVTVIFTGGSNFVPEDIVVGPDKKLYICNSDFNQIIRMDLNGSNVETIYDAINFSETSHPQGPEGPSFHGAGDLYFNTRGFTTHSGVWKMPGIASIGMGGSFPAPVNVLTATQTGSTFGEGTTFATNGALLVVDRSGNRVLRSSPPYTSVSPLITTGLDIPFGIAVNSTGDIFVSSEGDLNNIKRYSSTGAFKSVWASFTEGDQPVYIEFDGADNLFVATTQGAANGKVWKVDPSGTLTLVKALDPIGCEFECSPPRAVGLAVVPTPVPITQTFSPGNTTNTYNFGSSTTQIQFLGNVLTTFDLTITKTPTSPADLAAMLSNPEVFSAVGLAAPLNTSAVFPPGTTCMHESSAGGFCTSYVATSTGGLPQQGTDFTGNYQVKIAYFSEDVVLNPGMGHEKNGLIQEDILTDFSPNATPGSDPAGQGRTDNFSGFVMLNEPLIQNGNFCGFRPPLLFSGRIFGAGAEIPVKFQVTTGPNCTGSFITDAVARISVSKLTSGGPVLQKIHSDDHFNKGNLFRVVGKQYIFILETDNLRPGMYQITVFSNRFRLQTILFQLRKERE